MSSLTTKSVLITGCSAGGIGHALAMEYHSRGLRVFATARNADSMAELKNLGITTMTLDVTNAEAIQKVRDEIAERTGGKLDILVNNAGLMSVTSSFNNGTFPMHFLAQAIAATDIQMPDVRALFDVNLFAPMAMVKYFVHLLVASGDARIVQIGSISGIMPVPFSAAYNTSKAALHAFSNSLRVELAPFNIKIVNVTTGAVKSNIAKPNTIPEDSLYKSMEDLYQEKRINRSQMGAMPTDAYARAVVSESLKVKPRAWLWAGKNSWLCWFINTFLPRTAFDGLMAKTFGFDEFGSWIKSGKVKVL